MNPDVAHMTAAGIARRIRDGDRSPVEVVDEVLESIVERNAFGDHTPFSHLGPMACTVEDAALMLDVMADGASDWDPRVDGEETRTRGIAGR